MACASLVAAVISASATCWPCSAAAASSLTVSVSCFVLGVREAILGRGDGQRIGLGVLGQGKLVRSGGAVFQVGPASQLPPRGDQTRSAYGQTSFGQSCLWPGDWSKQASVYTGQLEPICSGHDAELRFRLGYAHLQLRVWPIVTALFSIGVLGSARRPLGPRPARFHAVVAMGSLARARHFQWHDGFGRQFTFPGSKGSRSWPARR